jgi:hypothetical protein
MFRSSSSAALLGALLCSASALPGCGLLKQLSAGSNPPGPAAPFDGTPLRPDEAGYTDPGAWAGPLAERFAGKVIFSAEPIGHADADAIGLYTTYALGKPLFIRFWMADSPRNFFPGCPKYALKTRAFIDGASVASLSSTTQRDETPGRIAQQISSTSLTGPIRRSEFASARARFGHWFVPHLKEGANTVKVEVELSCALSGHPGKAVVASGTVQMMTRPGQVYGYLVEQGFVHPKPRGEGHTDEILEKLRAALGRFRKTFDIAGLRVTSALKPARHVKTGILVGHRVDALMTERLPSGLCRLVDLGFFKDAAGTTFKVSRDPKPQEGLMPCAAALE